MMIKLIAGICFLSVIMHSYADTGYDVKYCIKESAPSKKQKELLEAIIGTKKYDDGYSEEKYFNGQCVLTLSFFLKETYYVNNMGFKLSNFESIKCFKKEDKIKLVFKAIAVECNENMDIRQTNYSSFLVFNNFNSPNKENRPLPEICKKDKYFHNSRHYICDL